MTTITYRLGTVGQRVFAPEQPDGTLPPLDGLRMEVRVAAQAGRSRLLAWDSLLDWCGVTLGVAFASHLAHGDRRHALAAVVAVFIISAVGYAICARRAQEAQ